MLNCTHTHTLNKIENIYKCNYIQINPSSISLIMLKLNTNKMLNLIQN